MDYSLARAGKQRPGSGHPANRVEGEVSHFGCANNEFRSGENQPFRSFGETDCWDHEPPIRKMFSLEIAEYAFGETVSRGMSCARLVSDYASTGTGLK
jgi:hypothetical protein